MPEFTAWATYFDSVIGARPYWFSHCDGDESKSFTAPAQWPEWFDPPPLEPPRERRPHPLTVIDQDRMRRALAIGRHADKLAAQAEERA